MTVENFIDEAFNRLVNNFPDATILYQNNKNSGSHFFKITPIAIYNTYPFIEFSSNLIDEFNDKDFGDMLGFLTEDSLIKLEQPTKKHLPESALNEQVSLFDENIGFLNVFVKNDARIVRTIEYSSFNVISNNASVGHSNFAMAA